MSESQPLVSVAVINYNGMAHLEDCLSSLVSQTYPNLELLVSDDVSTDESVWFIRSSYPSVRVVQNPRNMGFVATANRAMRSGSGDWMILLNNDVECERDFVERLMSAAAANPDVGVFAAKMRLFYARTVLYGVGSEMCKSCFGVDRGLGEKDEGQYDEPCEVFGACAGAMLIKKEVLQRVGYMDPAFRFTFDDIDLCWRARLLGVRVLSVPDAVVYHKFGGSYGRASTLKYFMSSKNRLRSFLKNYEFKTIRKLALEVVREDIQLIQSMYKFRIPSRFAMTRAIVKSYLWNILHSPSTYLARRKVQKSRVVSDEALKRFIYQGPGRTPVLLPSYDIVDLDLFRQKDVKVDRIVMGLTDENSLGPGWDSAIAEPGDQSLHRSCTKQSYFYLRVLTASKAWLNMRVRGVPKAISGRVTLNGTFVGDFTVPPGDASILSFRIPDAVLAQDVLECIITLDETWRPIDYFPGYDNRELGISFYEISLDEKPLTDCALRIADCGLQIGDLRKVLVLRSARPHFCVRALRQIREDLDSAEVSLLLQQGSERTSYDSLVDNVIPYPGQTFSLETAGKSFSDELRAMAFDLCVVVYGHMPRSSYRKVERLARAAGAPLILGIPPEGKPVVIRNNTQAAWNAGT